MKKILFLFNIIIISYSSYAQHDHKMMMGDTMPRQKKDTMKMAPNNMDGMDMKKMNHHMSMSHVYSLNLPMSRNGSGTGWLPDASPMYGYMFHTPKWMYMLHGNLFLRYNNQDFSNKGTRGNSKIDAPDWVMFMGQHKVAQNGLFHFSIMSSLDAVTGSNGYPLLFQAVKRIKENRLLTGSIPMTFFPSYR